MANSMSPLRIQSRSRMSAGVGEFVSEDRVGIVLNKDIEKGKEMGVRVGWEFRKYR